MNRAIKILENYKIDVQEMRHSFKNNTNDDEAINSIDKALKLLKSNDNCKVCGHENIKSDPRKEEKICMKCYAVHNWDMKLL